jgi:hypothetical protein
VSAVGLIGILLCLGALPFFPPARSSRGLLLFGTLLALHLAASVAFYEYALTSSADAALYYYDTTGLRRSEMELGTIFTIKLVQSIKGAVGGTYLDHFLLFQALGFWGILLLQRCIDHTRQTFGDALTIAPYWVLFLPGLHFWTGAIGKDSPLFLGVSLALWATIRLSTRAMWFALAVFIMLLFRPHIALLATAALAGGAFFGSRSGALAKISLVVVALVAVSIIAGTVERTLTVNLSDPSSVGAFLEKQQQRAQWIPGATNLQDAFVLVRLFSLLFRPLFVDASGAFGLVSSAENLVYLFIFAFMAWAWKEGIIAFRSALVVRFAFFFAAGVTVLLTLTYYNVGLGLRQKTMFMPAVLTCFAAQWMLRRARTHWRLYGGDMPQASPDEFGLQQGPAMLPQPGSPG